MKFQNLNEILFVTCFVTIFITINSVTCTLSYENKDYVKIKQDPTRFQQVSAYLNKKNIFSPRNLNVTTRGGDKNKRSNSVHQASTRTPSINKTSSQSGGYKKWQVGRVSRKQYEIINMLWRKTKMFVNVDQTTPTNQHLRRENDSKRVLDNSNGPRHRFLRFTSRPNVPLTTPSYIEFYYLDEADDRGKETTSQKNMYHRNLRERQLKNFGNFKFVFDSPMFSFRIDDPSYKRSAIPTRYMHPTNKMRKRKTRPQDASISGFDSYHSITPSHKFPHKRAKGSLKVTTINRRTKNITTITHTRTKQDNHNLNVSHQEDFSSIEYTLSNETCPITTEALTTLTDTIENETIPDYSISVTNRTAPTTVYDKIKFFEIYDKQTPFPYYDDKGKLVDMDNIDIFVKGNEINDDRKVLLEHVDQGIGIEHKIRHKTKHSKKHIIDNYKAETKNTTHQTLMDTKPTTRFVTLNISASPIANITQKPLNRTSKPASTVKNFFEYKKSKVARWSEYPFAAAYVYEPSQVHCDAAGISPHWLISSASCLSRHHKNPGGEGRSAFVTYCGVSWWNPERVAYVKYSLVHPRFHHRDKTRRHLYNIGLIQVVTSMASACSGWSSITIMSHQFIADPDGSTANAIGWGLDRFDTRYSSNDLPKTPLMTYESRVFSDSCPGNVGYNKAKDLDEEGGVKNVYCLSLPPYTGEDNDPVHGGLLLVGGKLVALYLQEERRPWGEQSAQYTGTWGLVPWVLDMARETEETESFALDI
ncbi:unnamed protein product [Chrysodeixis includens]|uniref:Peptidase S1 domain-containing protein n=1 Tax=Chrysodeixis includens TaxID=689277 RepID=A0A9P0G0G7_CHRIL|nr:unnamed protein product [Chrysodeixis includens]